MSGAHESFPNLTFLGFSVTQQGVNANALALALGTHGHAHGGGNALTQRTGGHVHTGSQIHVGVALQVAADFTQSFQIFQREEAAVGQRGIQAGGAVALGENKTVAILPLGVGRIHIHFLEIQPSEYIGSRQAAAGMTGVGTVHSINDTQPHFACSDLKLFTLFFGKHTFLLYGHRPGIYITRYYRLYDSSTP